MIQEVFPMRLKQLRLAQRLSQHDLANALGVSRSSVRNWEIADAMPPIEDMVNISLFFNVTLDYLTGLESRKTLQVDFLEDNTVNALSFLLRAFKDEKETEIKK